jgi:hypothetical protein
MSRKEKIEKNMEFLIKELQKEWDVSKETKHSIVLTLERARECRQKVQETITKYGKQLGGDDDIPFKESMRTCRDNYIMLRFARKLVKGYDRAVAAGDTAFLLRLDREEARVYRKITKET